MDRSDENMDRFAQFLKMHCEKEELPHFDRSGVARMIEYSAELTGDQTKLSARFADICDMVREAGYWASQSENGLVTRQDVQKAIDEKIYRSNRIEKRIQEIIERGQIYISTDGAVVGQVNGLSVMMLGKYMFGKPSRITARTYMGRGGVTNIEREVRMSGPIHNKGVMILSGYINGKYGQEDPVSMSAQIGFEQLYEGVEGDSASSTELYAILSSLSEIPIKQGIAVTGSVNQLGEIQPIGGVTQKIEGFFEVCKAFGLTGEQGVLIPKSNVTNLMLKEEVIEAVKEGKFHIYPVETIEQGIEILTGVEAGELQDDGTYPENSINWAVEEKLAEFAEGMKKHGEEEEKETTEEEDSGKEETPEEE
jgi:lon-related putative ATP-dependent protease